jgi:hypothetical protein
LVKRIELGEFVYTKHLPLTEITAAVLLLIGVFRFVAILV